MKITIRLEDDNSSVESPSLIKHVIDTENPKEEDEAEYDLGEQDGKALTLVIEKE